VAAVALIAPVSDFNYAANNGGPNVLVGFLQADVYSVPAGQTAIRVVTSLSGPLITRLKSACPPATCPHAQK
jgi:hypothetical protein